MVIRIELSCLSSRLQLSKLKKKEAAAGDESLLGTWWTVDVYFIKEWMKSFISAIFIGKLYVMGNIHSTFLSGIQNSSLTFPDDSVPLGFISAAWGMLWVSHSDVQWWLLHSVVHFWSSHFCIQSSCQVCFCFCFVFLVIASVPVLPAIFLHLHICCFSCDATEEVGWMSCPTCM